MQKETLPLSTAFVNPIITSVSEEITSRGLPETLKDIKPTFNKIEQVRQLLNDKGDHCKNHGRGGLVGRGLRGGGRGGGRSGRDGGGRDGGERDGGGGRTGTTTPRLKPPRNSRNKIPLNDVVCIICSETGHWAKTCVNVHPKFKETQAKRKAVSVVNARQLVDDHGVPYVFVIPDVLVFDPGMSNSLVSAGRLMEADYRVIFRILSNADSDGFPSAQFPLYGGSVTTPDGSTVIIMEYVNHTWRLPKVPVGSPVLSMPLPPKSLYSLFISAEDLSDIVVMSNIPTCNSFSSLPKDLDSDIEAYVPTFLSNERVQRRLQQRFENVCRLRKEAVTLHRAHGHPNNQTSLNLEGTRYSPQTFEALYLSCVL